MTFLSTTSAQKRRRSEENTEEKHSEETMFSTVSSFQCAGFTQNCHFTSFDFIKSIPSIQINARILKFKLTTKNDWENKKTFGISTSVWIPGWGNLNASCRSEPIKISVVQATFFPTMCGPPDVCSTRLFRPNGVVKHRSRHSTWRKAMSSSNDFYRSFIWAAWRV